MNDGGLFASLKSIAATLLSTGQTRLELLGNEIEEEKLRAIRLLLMAQGMAFCLGVGSLLAVGLLSLLFWDNRLLVVGIFCLLFLALGGFFYIQFKRAVHRPEPLFSTSIAELQEDLRQLKAVAGHESAFK